MFVAVLFTRAKILKQPSCPTTDEWIKKMCFSMLLAHGPHFEYQRVSTLQLLSLIFCAVTEQGKSRVYSYKLLIFRNIFIVVP
jgi:hypothetical protein